MQSLIRLKVERRKMSSILVHGMVISVAAEHLLRTDESKPPNFLSVVQVICVFVEVIKSQDSKGSDSQSGLRINV